MQGQEDDDLEEELRRLDVREDHGDEDSDVTPTNTPPPASLPAHPLYIKKLYPPLFPLQGRPSRDEDWRYSSQDDYDSRTESSLSWGEDEFEGEATRQVGLLFDQLDKLLYKEKPSLTPIPKCCDVSKFLLSRPKMTIEADGIGSESQQSEETLVLSSPTTSEGDRSSLSFYEDSRLLDSGQQSLETETAPVSVPTQELKDECSTWVRHFPHFRARGYSISTELLNILDQCLESQDLNQTDVEKEVNECEGEDEEEVLAQDGDYCHLLPLVSVEWSGLARQGQRGRVEPRKEPPTSRVCSGSNDPEVLKEQVLIVLFDRIWGQVTEVVSPLLHRYARYVIEQSVQYSSLSREPSTQGLRGPRVPPISRKLSGDLTNAAVGNHVLPPESGLGRPSSGWGGRPLSGIRRPVSAANRLHKVSSEPDIPKEELQDLLQVSSKPLQSSQDRWQQQRTSSASLSTSRDEEGEGKWWLSQVSLPSLATPRTSAQRPVSSRVASHLLTPIKVDSVGRDQRPASTSSYHARAKIQETFQHMSRQSTIQELGGDSAGVAEEDPATPTWSRHLPFLPPITDTTDHSSRPGSMRSQHTGRSSAVRRRGASGDPSITFPQETQPQSPTTTGENHPGLALSIRGTPFQATHRPSPHPLPRKQMWGTPITETGRSQKLIRPTRIPSTRSRLPR